MTRGDAVELVERMRRKAPEYLDLLTAETDEEFEQAFDAILEKAVSRLEANKKNLKSLQEPALSGVLAMALSVPGLTVTQEPYSNGHVDLIIDADHCFPARRKLAEAKIYDGPEYHIKGLKQLLDRYTTGREGRGLILVYCQKKDISGSMEKIRTKMDSALPCKQQGKTAYHVLKWSFMSTHQLSSGDDHVVGHVGCNLCVE